MSFLGVVFDDVELLGEDAGEEFNDLVAGEMGVAIEEVAPNGAVDVPAHHVPCLLLGGYHASVGISALNSTPEMYTRPHTGTSAMLSKSRFGLA
jgi:hypothetical protein